MLIANETNLIPRFFIHTVGDAHIYLNHVEQVLEQILREPKDYPVVKIKDDSKGKSIFDIVYDDIILEKYDCHPTIKGVVSV